MKLHTLHQHQFGYYSLEFTADDIAMLNCFLITPVSFFYTTVSYTDT